MEEMDEKKLMEVVIFFLRGILRTMIYNLLMSLVYYWVQSAQTMLEDAEL